MVWPSRGLDDQVEMSQSSIRALALKISPLKTKTFVFAKKNKEKLTEWK